METAILYAIIFGYWFCGLASAAMYLWKRRYALIGSDPLITILTAGAIVGSWPIAAVIYAIRRARKYD